MNMNIRVLDIVEYLSFHINAYLFQNQYTCGANTHTVKQEKAEVTFKATHFEILLSFESDILKKRKIFFIFN